MEGRGFSQSVLKRFQKPKMGLLFFPGRPGRGTGREAEVVSGGSVSNGEGTPTPGEGLQRASGVRTLQACGL